MDTNNEKKETVVISHESLDLLAEKIVDLMVKRGLLIQVNHEEESSKAKTYLYLKNFDGDKTFSKADENQENSSYRLFDRKDDEASFEFCGNEKEAIAQRIFDNHACELEGRYKGATAVKTEKPGMVKFVDGKWIVTKCVNIKLS